MGGDATDHDPKKRVCVRVRLGVGLGIGVGVGVGLWEVMPLNPIQDH